MEDISHPTLNNNSVFKIYKSKNESFLYSILAALYSNKIDRRSFHHPEAYEKFKRKINTKNISFPMKNKNIIHFLKHNPNLNISIRLFDSVVTSKNDMKIYEHKVIGKGKKIINILFHKSYIKKKSFYHYFWLKNINNIQKKFKKGFVCVICYDKFSTSKALNRHLLLCNALTKEEYPSPGTFLSYDDKKAAKYAYPLSIIGFADFETKLNINENVNVTFEDSLKSNESFTVRKNVHIIVSFSVVFVDIDGKLLYEKTFCGDNAGEVFLSTLDEIEEKLLLSICKNKSPLDIKSLSQEELERFNNATHCKICHVKFESNDRLKCKNLDHDHYTNKYRSASCTMCNLLNRSQNHIPIYFHNFCSYDSKLLLNVINKNRKPRVIPKFLFSNLQKLRYLTYNGYKFKDSLEHLPSSLSKLVVELNNPHQNHQFPLFHQSTIIKDYFSKDITQDDINVNMKLLTGGKGIYPYSLCNDAHVMRKIKTFPPIENFFNDLTNTPCTPIDYDFALNVYKKFKCRNLYDYTILYNHTDTLLLAEIMMVYRKVIQDNFKIDVNHFQGIPALAYNLMLKISKVKLELISDPEMSEFFRSSIRGGMSFIANRKVKSDYVNSNPENYKKRTTHIRYIDGNNLYGSQMLFDLPTTDYKFEDVSFIAKIESQLKQNKSIDIKGRGLFLEVDLHYPKKLHKNHADFPLAPEKYKVTYKELSPLNQFLLKKMKKNDSCHTFSEEKLIPTFHERKHYKLHIKCLLFYLSEGLILKKIHRIVSFKEKPFLKEYILSLTKLRSIAAAKNLTFFVNVFKLLANSTYGKFCQNPMNFTHAKLCLNKQHFKKCINSKRFLHASIINESIAIVEYKPEAVLYNSPFPIAATILDLAKLHLYNYFYNILKPTFEPDKVNLIMTDTDSIIFSVNTQNFFEKYKRLPLFDFSNFKKESSLYSNQNQKALLFFKDENPNDFIKEFIGLRSKLYVIKTVTNQEDKKAKGYNKKFKDTLLSYEKYKKCHEDLDLYRSPLITIRGIDHQLYTVLQNKVVLNNFDNKMYICNCNIHTYFYGSNDLKSTCNKCN